MDKPRPYHTAAVDEVGCWTFWQILATRILPTLERGYIGLGYIG